MSNRSLLVVLLVVAALLVWMWWRAEPDAGMTPPDHEALAQPDVVTPAQSEPRMRREAAAVPEDDTEAGAASKTAPAEPVGLHGKVRELAGPGLSGVRLELVDAAGEVLETTVSGAGGAFAFERRLPQGAVVTTQLASGDGPKLRHKLSMPRTPGPGGAAQVVAIWLPPCGRIDGTVVDADGRPVEGASVMSDRPTNTMMMGPKSWQVIEGEVPEPLMFTKTDAQGQFALTGMYAGSHRIGVTHGDEEASARVPVGTRGLVLRLGTHTGGAVVLTAQVTDRTTGAPVPDARVDVMVVRRSRGGSSAVGVSNGKTDANGSCEVHGLDVGRYRLTVNGPKHARGEIEKDFEAGRHVVDFALDPARQLSISVVDPDGGPPGRVEVRAFDADGKQLSLPGRRGMTSDSARVDKEGKVVLRRLPAQPLRLVAVRGDLYPAGRLDVDLTGAAPASVTITMPTKAQAHARSHYFQLQGPDGKPAEIDGLVVAESFDGAELLSRVEGRWRGERFYFGHDERNGFERPTIAVGAMAGPCLVRIQVPGYRAYEGTLEPGTKSPTVVRLLR